LAVYIFLPIIFKTSSASLGLTSAVLGTDFSHSNSISLIFALHDFSSSKIFICRVGI
jgi:hypothetical protein